MKITEPEKDFTSTIQNYQEALACLEVAARCLRVGKKRDSLRPRPQSRLHSSSHLCDRHDACNHNTSTASSTSLQYRPSNDNTRRGHQGTGRHHSLDGMFDHGDTSTPLIDRSLASTSASYGDSGSLRVDIPDNKYSSFGGSSTVSGGHNDATNSSSSDSTLSWSSTDTAAPVGATAAPYAGAAGVSSRLHNSNIVSHTAAWSSSSPLSSLSRRGGGGTDDDPSMDQAVAAVQLVERCTKAIAAIQADLSTNSVLVKESLQALVQSLRLHKMLLEQRTRPKPTSPSAPAPHTAHVAPAQDAAPVAPTPYAAPAYSVDVNSYFPTAGGRSSVAAVRSSVSGMREVLPPGGGKGEGGTGLDGVVGLHEVKQVLHEAFLWPAQFPHLFQGGALESWSRLLLYGPPGTGKTRLARALASDLQCPLYTVTPSLLLSSMFGETEKIIRELFVRVRSEAGPVVLFMDEMDSLCRTRGSKEDDTTRRIKTELMVHLNLEERGQRPLKRHRTDNTPCTSGPPIGDSVTDDDIAMQFNEEGYDDDDGHFSDSYRDTTSDNYSSSDNSRDGNKLFIIAATNCPWDIDPAFLRRFQKRCYVDLPQSCERHCLLEGGLQGCATDLSESDWLEAVAATEGYSGADLNTVAKTAAFRPIRQLHTARYWRFTHENKIMPCSSDTLGAMQYTVDKLPPNMVTTCPVSLDDLLAAARSTPRSVPDSLLRQYRDFAQL